MDSIQFININKFNSDGTSEKALPEQSPNIPAWEKLLMNRSAAPQRNYEPIRQIRENTKAETAVKYEKQQETNYKNQSAARYNGVSETGQNTDNHYIDLPRASAAENLHRADTPKSAPVAAPAVLSEAKPGPVAAPAVLAKAKPALVAAPPVLAEAKPAPAKPPKGSPRKAKGGITLRSIIGNILYYGAIALFLYGAFCFAKSEDAGKSILGYRPYTILTPSMKSIYPVGSMVIVKLMPPEELVVGDDITFYYPDNPAYPVWTHRIIEILPDYHGYGISFRTQGVDNREPDPFITFGANVVGEVKFCIPKAGIVATFITTHMIVAMGFLMFLCFFILLVGDLLRKEPAEPRYSFDSDHIREERLNA